MLFQVDIEGHGFAFERDGRPIGASFIARRYVDATDHDEAQELAVELLSAELVSSQIAATPPLLEVIAIKKVERAPSEQPPIDWHEPEA